FIGGVYTCYILACLCCVMYVFYFFFFFFQAEDGIRDDLVTGVQTCALPICHARVVEEIAPGVSRVAHRIVNSYIVTDANEGAWRSEERRVGKECRCGWAA